MPVRELPLSAPLQGAMLVGDPASGVGVVVLAGSSGRVDVERARRFAEKGAVAIGLRWFGGEGQTPGICEVPLESFDLATTHLVEAGCRRLVYVGTSKGAEAALLLATHDPRIDIVVAISPSSVVWANIGPGRDGRATPARSSWTRDGAPLDFVAYDPAWRPERRDGLVAFRSLHEQSLVTYAARLDAAAIPVERARAEVVLVAGGDDALWPSLRFAEAIADRCPRATLISHPSAGHRVPLPGETTPRSTQHAHGGSDHADAELGRLAWDAIEKALQ